jgi:hypothetical protein
MLFDILARYIPDERTHALLAEVVGSFHSTAPGKGLPLGNLTSQILVNVYMNEFDQFVKHQLKAKYYVRYADDFVFLSASRRRLDALLPEIEALLDGKLKLSLHPDKVYIKTFSSGVDFLGWVHFPGYRVLRNATKRRMMRSFGEDTNEARTDSYRGMLSHGNARRLLKKVIG